MIIDRRHHRVPGLNTTSTADISFMLLIFFLVTTSMNVDKGLRHQLPPAPKQQQQAPSEVDKRHLMVLTIGADGGLTVDGQPARIPTMSHRIATFIRKAGSRHIIRLSADPQSTYDSYFQLQNQIAKAYSDVRNAMAITHYGHPLRQCTDYQRAAIQQLCPQRVVEEVAPQKGGKQ